jgi:hypothetical protein
MYTVVKRVLLISAVLVLVFAMTLATRSPETSASESSALTGGHVDSERLTGAIGLGPSQEDRCKHTPPDDRIHYEECASAKYLLTLMSAERRDNVWADQMESELRKWIDSLASEGFISKRVECRLSWCVVEVGSTQSRVLEMDLRVAQKRKLFDLKDLFAPDIDDPSIQDQLIIYKRYCNSVKEVLDPNSHVVRTIPTVGQGC